MDPKTTHFKYLCRNCGKEILQPILKDDPANTPIPTCCGGTRRNMAYKGHHQEQP